MISCVIHASNANSVSSEFIAFSRAVLSYEKFSGIVTVGHTSVATPLGIGILSKPLSVGVSGEASL